jgi:4-amino-4-deoxy-L-arabinose transferase-like glycosyltransferase
VALITLGAAALRLLDIGRVVPDPFYDAAVRSMGLSWHNFFFGAFEPGGSVSIDKPPVDLWLQVVSVKLFGFSSTTLKLPEALAGTASVPLLYVTVRRMWSPAAGIAAALAMAVLPIEVITARSDTMDGVMMLTLVLALLSLVRAAETGRKVWLLAAAAALGVAFNVKLLESLIALPGLAVFAYLGLPGPRVRRILQLALAGVVYVVVALSWLTATLIAPASDRPYAIGSTNGSAWNAAFVFNGTDRLGGKVVEPGSTSFEAGHHYPEATQEQRDHIPIVPPSPTRLLARIGPLSGERLGLEVLIGLILGIPALLWGLWRGGDGGAAEDPTAKPTASTEADRKDGAGANLPASPSISEGTVAVAAGEPASSTPAEPDGADRARMRRAAAGGITLWMIVGVVMFSHMIRLHPRYVEGFTPAVAIMLGIGVAWAASTSGRIRLAFLLVSLVVSVYYVERLLYGRPGTWWVTLLGALGALALALLSRLPAMRSPVRSLAAYSGVVALTLVAVLTMGLRADANAIEDHVSDAGYVGALPPEQQRVVSSFLLSHQHGAHYELAAESATEIGSIIVQDVQPVLILTTYDGRVFTPVSKLKRLIAAGEVRYAFLNSFCAGPGQDINPACAGPVKWIRAHGKDVSIKAGLPQGGLLYLLPGAKP